MGSKQRRVAIIGAGINGLAALRRLSEINGVELTCFERNYDIGGIWLYTDETREDEFGRPVYSPVYSNLSCNTPKELTEMDGIPMEGDIPEFPTQWQVMDYMRKIAEKFDLRKFIKFNMEVLSIRTVQPGNKDTGFVVEYADTRKKMERRKEEFDAVILCNGPNRIPNIPKIEGEDQFKGLVIHSVKYRHPEIFRNQRVAVLGASFSGTDISFDLTKFVKKIYLCHREPKIEMPLLDNMTEKLSPITRFTPSSVILANGEEIEVDAVIHCTGYKYDLPLLPEVELKIHGVQKVITSLYKCMISPDFNNLFFMGVVLQMPFFYMADHQALFIKAFLEGSAKLPDKPEMAKTIAKDAEASVYWKSCFEWDRQLSKIAGNFSPHPNSMRERWETNFQACVAGSHYKHLFN